MLLDERSASPPATDALRYARRGFADTVPTSLRRLFRLPEPSPADELPPELAFLIAQGVAPHILHAAARIAATAGVTGEAALLGLGFSDERYHRLLARHLGVPYLHAPLPLARENVDPIGCAAAGWAPLAPNPGNIAHVLAARGEALRGLIRDHSFADIGQYGFALTTRRRFEALLRRHDEEGLRERAASGLADWDAALSARGGVTPRQRGAGLVLATLLALSLACAPATAGVTVSIVLFVVFAAAVAQSLMVTAGSRCPGPLAVNRMPDHDLPVYTLIVPLFREARVLPALIRNLDAIDYPRAKLDVKIMLERSDRDTIAVAASLALPARYDVIVLPDGHPRTKPRALNAALETAQGDIVVVYDAEDRPDPGQLRAAASRFAEAPAHLACLQARLTVDHPDETWITRLFAIDYAALFHVVKPGLAALRLPIPLGGTSNHFRAAALRRVGGWDAWNVTEDIDLGYRLARFGFTVGSLDSDTFEEAPLTLARWLPQRSRWLKGWMVTLIVHGRQPYRLFRELGWRAGLSVTISLCATVLSCLVGPPLLALVVVEACRGALFRPETPLWWLSVVSGAVLLVGGAAAVLWPAIAGLRRVRRLDLVPWLAALPLYLLLVSAAAWRALFELWRDPQGWNKTEHGLAKRRAAPDAEPAARRALTIVNRRDRDHAETAFPRNPAGSTTPDDAVPVEP